MFCIPLRQEHRLSAPKNINRKKYQVIIPPPLSNPTPPSLTECCDEYLYDFVCERLPEWQKVCAQSALCICETIRPPFFLDETAIILTSRVFTLQESCSRPVKSLKKLFIIGGKV